MYKFSELVILDIDSIIEYTIDNFGVDKMLKYHASLEKCFETFDDNPQIGLASDFIKETIIVSIINHT